MSHSNDSNVKMYVKHGTSLSYTILKTFYFLTSLIVIVLIQNVSCSKDVILTSNSIKLIDQPKCILIKKFCGHLKSEDDDDDDEADDDLNVLDCLQTLSTDNIKKVHKECQQIISEHTDNIIKDENVQDRLEKVCEIKLETLNCKIHTHEASLLGCVLDNRENINDIPCLREIQRLEVAAFFDLRWLMQFLHICSNDISKRCNNVNLESNKDFLTKSQLPACLQSHIDVLQPKCKMQVFKLTEMQADNINLDRQLSEACSSDRLRLCRSVQPGSGLVFKCLIQHRDEEMSDTCKIQLLKRQKLVAQDFKISKGMMKACREDIRKSHCRKQISDDKTVRLAQILLCLENYKRNVTKVSANCEAEMIDQRKMLMEDYQLTPEIVNSCTSDINSFCSDVNGRTIHCLMEHAMPRNNKKRIQDVCLRALEDLIKETDAGEDWRVDPVLREACQLSVNHLCSEIHRGDARVMSCLMDNLRTNRVDKICEKALVQIQYFVARDFSLDPQLYRSCHEDAEKICHARKNWASERSYDTENAPLILPCLYRYANHDGNSVSLKPECLKEIQRVMRQRAISVDLQPEIEEQCLEDLSMYCVDHVERGEETMCLQKHMADLKKNCRMALSNFTEEEARHVELNPVIMAHCGTIIDRHCTIKVDEGDIMECLIMHKNNPDVRSESKCRAAVEHFQLISLKNYHFTYKFKLACKPFVKRYCQEASTKADVISCLSEIVRNDTLLSQRNKITKDCRQQLRTQLFQQRENINLDVKLKEACKKDIDEFCHNITPGSSEVLECLKSTESKLSPSCQKQIFRVRVQDMKDNSIDYTLITMCHDSIKQYCENKELAKVLECLKEFKDKPNFDKKCKHIVVHRLIEQNRDYRFNGNLQSRCKKDIQKFCSHILSMQGEVELGGNVTECLKKQFRKNNLSTECQTEMTQVLRDQALNYQLNPLLKVVCSADIDKYCANNKDVDDSSGQTEECLKNTFLDKMPMAKLCINEIVILIEESEADIHIDPLLQKVCTIDLHRYCYEVQPGRGKQLNCLRVVMEKNLIPFEPECKTMLSKRIQMYKNADKSYQSIENLQALYTQVVASPAKRYFMIVLITAIGVVFFIGLFCGRVTRRARFSKNK